MRLLIVAAAFTLAMSTAQSAPRGGGGGGENFFCDDSAQFCTCVGDADCKDLAGSGLCDKDGVGTWCGWAVCTSGCWYGLRQTQSGKLRIPTKGNVTSPPTGLLEGGSGFSTQSPGAIGTPISPPGGRRGSGTLY
jgi:hypothetical protein